ncbi:MAG: hypothetical protein WBQ69_05210 [Gallionella sp.]
MNIASWLANNRDAQIDRERNDLLAGKPDTTAAEKLWAEIAAGDASVSDTLMWAQHVAKQIKANVIDARGQSSTVRERGALHALGVSGRADVYRDARHYMETFASFELLDDTGRAVPIQYLTGEQWVGLLKAEGYLRDVQHKTALNRVNEWRKEFGIE